MTAQGEKRASGRTTGEEIAREHVAALDTPATVRPTEDATRMFDFTGFSRIRTEWRKADLEALDRVQNEVDDTLHDHFHSLYKVREWLFLQVREPMVNREGEVKLDRHGLIRWRKHPEGHPDAGMFVEDWSVLSDGRRRELVDRIVNYLFEWKTTAEHLRAEALYARASYEQLYAHAYESLPPISATRPTVDDREQRAKKDAAEERYFALYVTSLSRQADALIASMERLEQRQKDLLPQR